MITVIDNGQNHEITGRLASIIRWLIAHREEISHGHKTVEVECHGSVVKPRITEHFDPIT